MANPKVVLPPRALDPARERFAHRFLVAGAVLPGIMFVMGYVLGPWIGKGTLGFVLRAAWWVFWPSWILLFDAEHTPQIVFGLVVGAAVNAVWYWILGYLVWDCWKWLRGK